jgi:hypothetical protein
VYGSRALPPRRLPQCSCVVIESSFDPGERLQAPGSLWLLGKGVFGFIDGGNGFHKIHNNIAPVYLNDCLNEYLVDNNYNLRNSLQYRVPRCRFFPSTIHLWNSLELNFKSMQTTSKFKQTLRANLCKVSNYHMLGSRKYNIIHTRLRHQCSSLGAVLFRANITNDPSCPSGFPLEDAIHYL